MVKYGMTPLESIRSATTVAADCLGLGAVTGRVAPGYAADLIAVAGDPAERLQALGDLRLVLANGRTIRRDGDARPVPPVHTGWRSAFCSARNKAGSLGRL